MQLVQNTPGYEKNPTGKLNFIQAFSFLSQAKWYLIWFSLVVFGFLSLYLWFWVEEAVGLSTETYGQPISLTQVGFLIPLAIWIGLGANVYFQIKSVRNLPISEQEEYYRLGNVKPLTEPQQQALRLNVVDMFNSRAWSQTLENEPCELRVRGHNFNPRTFRLLPSNLNREGLHNDWGIVSKVDYNKMVKDLFAGMHSKYMAYDAQTKGHEDLVPYLAGLIQKPEAYVSDCMRGLGGKPGIFVWGFDLWRVLPLARHSFMAGYISEQEAWDDILRASELVYYLFDSHEAFYDNYRLGNAYWSRDMKTTLNRLDSWKTFEQKCTWPLHRLPWKKTDHVSLPVEMSTNFRAFVAEQHRQHGTQGANPIGYRF